MQGETRVQETEIYLCLLFVGRISFDKASENRSIAQQIRCLPNWTLVKSIGDESLMGLRLCIATFAFAETLYLCLCLTFNQPLS